MRINKQPDNPIRWLVRLSLLFICASSSAQDSIKLVDASASNVNDHSHYFVKLLTASLEATKEEYGGFSLEPHNITIGQTRQLRELSKGTFDVFWTLSTPARETQARAINIPLMKGAYGIRLLVANTADIGTFESLSSAQLAEHPALLGVDWPDTSILRVNRLTVETSLQDNQFYDLLRKRPGYYFPRGFFEAVPEIQDFPAGTFGIVKNKILLYPISMKFFVAPDNERLAARLALGLSRLKENGMFDKLFYEFTPHKQTIDALTLQQPDVIELVNPFLPSLKDAAEIYAEQYQLLERIGVKVPSRQQRKITVDAP
ncbi:hypothetical protein [Bowmanella sp. JS7-9]|uniref:Solute-binding protein family 3/N-terminal domain-containing protein n=3 Tax=Pseudobowmanella zhangzhouensis TaxID=1537679 RepID=A0ABW1XQ13_9ALTE|nr:hypothetical protein [Bowmanella sp. JS7-9]TBX23693.1 hypothetical protein TK45_06210 [Bowmanella sp. JS7-9]